MESQARSFENTDLKKDVEEALRALGIKTQKVEFLRYSVNQNFKITSSEGLAFLRVYRPGKETTDQILAEHAYIKFLKENGLNVPIARVLPNGESIGKIRDRFNFSLFEFAPGSHPTNFRNFAMEWGRLLGQLHSASKSYSKSPFPKRKTLLQSTWAEQSEAYLKKIESSAILLKERETVFRYLDDLERSDQTFGHVHYDFHPGNILVHEGKAHFLDFDDCCEAWYLWDFAMPMHRLGGSPMSTGGKELKEKFLSGYRETATLTENDESKIRIFERIRHLFMICWLAERATENKWKEIFPRYVSTHSAYLEAKPDLTNP